MRGIPFHITLLEEFKPDRWCERDRFRLGS
jgi:hypothetical protein